MPLFMVKKEVFEEHISKQRNIELRKEKAKKRCSSLSVRRM